MAKREMSLRNVLQTGYRGILSFVYSSNSRDVAKATHGGAYPDLVFFFKDQTVIPKVITSFQKVGFIVQELAPAVFSFQCKYDLLLHAAEKYGWKRMTNSQELITFVMDAMDEFENIANERAFFTSAERLILVRRLAEEDEVLKTLKSSQVTVVPLNEPTAQARLGKDWVFKPFARQPLNEIRAYLGEEIAFYFGFLGVYTTWLVLPSVLGVVLYFHQSYYGFATTETFAYCVFLAIWATLFLEHWKRKEKSLGFEWGCLDYEENEVERAEIVAAENGEVFTAEVLVHDPANAAKIYLGYVSSYALTLMSLLSGIFVMAFLLEMDAHAQKNWKGDDWTGLWAFAASMPNIGLSVSIMIYKSMNRALAVFTTKLEQRKSEIEKREALITKLAAFNFVNYYAALIHTAFVKRDLIQLRKTLITLLVVQQIVGQIAEIGVPLLKGALNYAFKKETGAQASVDSEDSAQTRQDKKVILARATREAALETYAGVFDDYLELWVQLGQVVLFSSVFPLAALIALMNNVIEIRTDAFKIMYATRRAIPNRKSGIGSWLQMFDFLGYAAVITNISLVGLVTLNSPERMEQLRESYNLSDFAVLLLLVGAEHLLVTFKVGLSYFIPDMPEELRLKLRMASQREETARIKTFEQRAKIKHLLSQFKTADGLKSAIRPSNGREENLSDALVAYVNEQVIAKTFAEQERTRAVNELGRIKQTLGSQSLGFLAIVVNVALAVIGGVLILSGE